MGIVGFYNLAKQANSDPFIWVNDFLSKFKIHDFNIFNFLDQEQFTINDIQLIKEFFNNYQLEQNDQFYYSLFNNKSDILKSEPYLNLKKDYSEQIFNPTDKEQNLILDSSLTRILKIKLLEGLELIINKIASDFYKENSILFIDAMILIHAFYEKSFKKNEFQMFSIFLRKVFLKIVWVFDGICPVAKCHEQLKRRISQFNKSQEFNLVNYKKQFNIFNPIFLKMLEEIYLLIDQDIIIDHTIFGEGDQKIFEFLPSIVTDQHTTIYILSNDWDVFVISAINAGIFKNKFRYVCPRGIIDVNDFNQKFDIKQSLNSIFLFGTDFYPGISNFYFNSFFVQYADYSNSYIEYDINSIQINTYNFKEFLKNNYHIFKFIEKDELTKYKTFLKKYHLKNIKEFEEELQKPNPDSDKISVLYDKTFFKFCTGKCSSCTFEYNEDQIINYLNILFWTINYFHQHKLLDKDFKYEYEFAPNVDHLIYFLENNPDFKFKNLFNSKIELIKTDFYEDLDKYKLINYPYCPKRNLFYRSQLKCKFIKLND